MSESTFGGELHMYPSSMSEMEIFRHEFVNCCKEERKKRGHNLRVKSLRYGVEELSPSFSYMQRALDYAAFDFATGLSLPVCIIADVGSVVDKVDELEANPSAEKVETDDDIGSGDEVMGFAELHDLLSLSCPEVSGQQILECHGGSQCLSTNFAALCAAR